MATPETMTREPEGGAASAWQSEAGDAPADFAALYRRAAGHISANGYSASGGSEGSGTSIIGALRYAAQSWTADAVRRGEPARGEPADIAELAEELETRLAGVLYVTGQLTRRTGINGLPDLVAGWDSERVRIYATTRYRYHTQGEAVAVLDLAAALFDTLALQLGAPVPRQERLA